MEDVSLWMKKVTRDRLMTVQTDVIQLVPSLVLLVLNMVNNAAQWVQLGVTTTLMDSQLTSHNKASRHLQKTSENFWHHFWCFRCVGLCLAPDQHRCIMGHVIEKTWICVCVCVCVCARVPGVRCWPVDLDVSVLDQQLKLFVSRHSALLSEHVPGEETHTLTNTGEVSDRCVLADRCYMKNRREKFGLGCGCSDWTWREYLSHNYFQDV